MDIQSFFSYGAPNMVSTADFLEFILQSFWKIVNVKNPILGILKRDDFCKPVSSDDDPKLQHLLTFHRFLRQWECSKYRGLSSQTSTAAKQSILALVGVAQYCLNELGFSFVLLGKFQSDQLQRRFGQFRQLSGGNFLISLRQMHG